MANWLAQHLDRNPEIARLPVYKRDRYSLHVRQRDGSVMAEFSTRPLHYQDEHGIWQPLDTSLRAAGNEYGVPGLDVFVATDGGVRVAKTKHRQRTGRVVVLDIATGKVKRVAGDLGAGRIEDDSLLRDAGTFRHRLRVTATGLREELTINTPLSGTSAAEWLMVETEMQGRSLPDGWVDDLKWAGRYQFRPPTCTAANGTRITARQYALKSGKRQMLYTGVPLAWLSVATYPVVLDPDFSVTAADGFVQGNSNSSYAEARDTCEFFDSANTSGIVGNQISEGKFTSWSVYRGYLAFATSGIGTNPVLAATLRLAVRSFDFAQLQDDLEITKFDWSTWNPVSSGNQEAVYDAALAAPKDVVWREAGFSFTNDTYYDSAEPLDTSWINRIGTTYYGLLAKHDRDAVEPSSYEQVSFNTSESSYPPIVRVIYGEAAVPSASEIAAAVLAAMNVDPPAVNVTMWKGATAPELTGDAFAQAYTATEYASDARTYAEKVAALVQGGGETGPLQFSAEALELAPGGLTAQEMANALLLTPVGTAAADSIVDQLNNILEDTGTTLPATLATIAGYIDTEVASIRAKTDLITSGGSVTVVSPVATDGDATLYQGDDYANADNRALDWSATTWPDLTSATILFMVRAQTGTLFSKAGSVVSAGGATQTVRVELTDDETATLQAWPADSELRIRATLASGGKATLVDSTLSVIEDIS